jgi:hypothetical protein
MQHVTYTTLGVLTLVLSICVYCLAYMACFWNITAILVTMLCVWMLRSPQGSRGAQQASLAVLVTTCIIMAGNIAFLCVPERLSRPWVQQLARDSLTTIPFKTWISISVFSIIILCLCAGLTGWTLSEGSKLG